MALSQIDNKVAIGHKEMRTALGEVKCLTMSSISEITGRIVPSTMYCQSGPTNATLYS